MKRETESSSCPYPNPCRCGFGQESGDCGHGECQRTGAWAILDAAEREGMTVTEYVKTPEPLPGYRTLNDNEKGLIDRIKAMEAEVGKLWAEVYTTVDDPTANSTRYSLRAEGQFRDAFMNLVRAVALPRDPYRDELIQRAAEGRY